MTDSYNAAQVRQFGRPQTRTASHVPKITDNLEGMKGHELGERLASSRPGMKVLYMSAYTEDAIVNYWILIPGTAFIEKPFSPDELAGKVREVLDANRDNLGAEYLHHG